MLFRDTWLTSALPRGGRHKIYSTSSPGPSFVVNQEEGSQSNMSEEILIHSQAAARLKVYLSNISSTFFMKDF